MLKERKEKERKGKEGVRDLNDNEKIVQAIDKKGVIDRR